MLPVPAGEDGARRTERIGRYAMSLGDGLVGGAAVFALDGDWLSVAVFLAVSVALRAVGRRMEGER